MGLLVVAPATAQDAPIADNSFLVEEAYNQEAGVVQHIQTFQRLRDGGGWAYTFTQEWPFRSIDHQLSYTLALEDPGDDGDSGIGDAALHYRYQAIGDGEAAIAFAPRLSLLLPTGEPEEGRGAGALGLQFNLPLSAVLAPNLVSHWNAGATYTPSAENAAGEEADLTDVNLAASFIWRLTTIDLMLEAAWASAEEVVGPGRAGRDEELFVSPGIRWAHDFASGLQVVPGIAFPIGVGPSDGEESIFLYLSLEHPF